MTERSDKKQMDEDLSKTFLPEDAPLDSVPAKTTQENIQNNETLNLLKETPANSLVDSRKFALGSSMLGWCLFLMLICIVLSLWYPNNELIKNGFEAFKLIVMTILGYIFGSSHIKTD